MTSPGPGEDTGRLEPVPRRPGGKRRVTLGLALALVVIALLVGVVLGYVARGGSPDRVLITTDQPVEVVTVTTEAPAP